MFASIDSETLRHSVAHPLEWGIATEALIAKVLHELILLFLYVLIHDHPDNKSNAEQSDDYAANNFDDLQRFRIHEVLFFYEEVSLIKIALKHHCNLTTVN